MTIPFEQSPNYTVGTGTPKTGYVLHATLGRFIGAKETLTGKNTNVSCHFLISEKDGECVELVKPHDIAWHAGKIDKPNAIGKTILQYDARSNPLNPNKYTIGIEFCCGWDSNKNGKVDVSELELTPYQIQACAEYMIRNYKEYGIPYDLMVGHTDLTSYKADNMYRHKETILKKIQELLPKKEQICIPKSEVSSMIQNKQVLGLFSYLRNLFK